MTSSALHHLSPHFEQYLTLHRLHPANVYNYAARKFSNRPVIEFTRHGPKCKDGESWVYVAVTIGATLAKLDRTQKLYVGAQTQDRMFRGDNLRGDNFHHAEMRRGKGLDNLEAFLRSGSEVVVHRIAAYEIHRAAKRIPELDRLLRLMQQPLPPRAHQAWWLEQYVLHHELPEWRWNTDGAISMVSAHLASAGEA